MNRVGIRVLLNTPLPGFANELCDVLKLFFPVEAFSWKKIPSGGSCGGEDDGEPLYHDFREESGTWYCRFAFRGREARRQTAVPPSLEEGRRDIVVKRLQKRLCKLTLYDLLKILTGLRPSWGALTGIRPTRLVYENLAHGMSLPESAAALTRDFDVPPEKAELLRHIVETQRTLPPPAPDEADVYISIPFCRTRCAYCSFPGEALGRAGKAEAYLAALGEEMEASAHMMAGAGIRLRALYIGGGTPTSIGEEAFSDLLDRVSRTFPHPVEFTVEAGRPDTLTRGKLDVMLSLGVTRISINPQTMNDLSLRRIGRGHTAGEIEEAFALARETGFANINMDVIAGLPGEEEADFAHTLEKIGELAPDSLTVHVLAIKRSSRLHLESLAEANSRNAGPVQPEGPTSGCLPSGGAVARMAALGEEAASRLGMVPYYIYRQKYMAGQQQNIGYARPGAACLYNVDIMEENASIVAVGAGAISKRVFPDRELRIERAPNVSDVSTYLRRTREMMERKERLFIRTDGIREG
ncbi:MAG: coproporphyrinogen dehydrogenase HemZ [Clostridia bacterium]|nr:coproporphyrinogen dehydrogenase HemZ [Clostridia bacterium]